MRKVEEKKRFRNLNILTELNQQILNKRRERDANLTKILGSDLSRMAAERELQSFGRFLNFVQTFMEFKMYNAYRRELYYNQSVGLGYSNHRSNFVAFFMPSTLKAEIISN